MNLLGYLLGGIGVIRVATDNGRADGTRTLSLWADPDPGAKLWTLCSPRRRSHRGRTHLLVHLHVANLVAGERHQ